MPIHTVPTHIAPTHIAPARIAIIGRPNVGKSTLFNRLTGKRLALVDDVPGVTRDRRQGAAQLGDLEFAAIDTAGLSGLSGGDMARAMQAQTARAIKDCDIVLFVIDARAGITPTDHEIARDLEKTGLPVCLVANKAEGTKGRDGALEGYELGLGDPVPVSAEHGEGLGLLHDVLSQMGARGAAGPDQIPPQEAARGPLHDLSIVIAGRPNTGKSTLVNFIAGEERMITGDNAGTTREAIAIKVPHKGRILRIVDTAGMRRRTRITQRIEKLSVSDTARAIGFAHVAVILLDARTPFHHQDMRIIDYAVREGRAVVIACNKWDLVEAPQILRRQLDEFGAKHLSHIAGVPILPVCARSGEGVTALIDATFDVSQYWSRRVATAKLNEWLADALTRHPPPMVNGRRIRLRYATQAHTRPPHFVMFCSRPEQLPVSYRRYLLASLRERFALSACPVRLSLRRTANPFAGHRRRRLS